MGTLPETTAVHGMEEGGREGGRGSQHEWVCLKELGPRRQRGTKVVFVLIDVCM